MLFGFPDVPIEIRSRKTDKVYILARGDRVLLDERARARIVGICNEPDVYDNVFAAILNGARYTERHATMFTKLVSDGWTNGDRFDWLILHKNEIVGTIGIKSLHGEIGYWQCNEHPGVMTSAARSVCSLAKAAGLPSMWAYVKKTNAPSIKVLEGAGFVLDAALTERREDAYGYRSDFQQSTDI
jgi:RimJ/RimL family protein N-acetyltransferase